MYKVGIFSFFICLFCAAVGFSQSYATFVNPMIGTGGHGHTFPGATVPYGMVQLSPDTRIDGSWDGCSGYHYSDNVIYGFSHTHLNGTGVSDFGDIMLMPTMGEPSFDNKVYSSSFSHDTEKATAGFYSVTLDKHNIDVRLTASTRVGFHEYTFNEKGQANIIMDLNHRDKLLEGRIRVIDEKTVEVLRRSEAWATNQYVYARIEFNVPLKINLVEEENTESTGSQGIYKGTKLALSFTKKVKKGEKILVKVSLSPTSYEGAKLNSSEITHWDFDKVRKQAEKSWNEELYKIQIETSDKDKKTIFYTALYHTMMQPNIAQDIDGKYRGRDNQIHTAIGFNYYSVFSLWDTFRAAHPLYTLIDKKRTSDYINTFLVQYEQGGRLPVWELASNETDCMIGYHSVSVIADAMAKGITGFNYENAFQAAKHSAMLDHLGLEAYKKQGFISIDDEHESVSKTVEYAYDDWCIAQMAHLLQKEDDYQYFMKRSQNWKNLFDWETGFIRPKKNGGWEKPFDPKEINNNFTEGNAWQYTFFVPQDVEGMIEAYGGKQKFEAKLDELFNSESKTTGREQVDVTGLIGQYAHGNEPSHHMAYLYNFVDKPEKTKEKVHYILNEFYKNAPDGLIGNEDCGQMSAWYVLSSLGIYQVTPGNDFWETTEPYFVNSKIKTEGKEARYIYRTDQKTDILPQFSREPIEEEPIQPITTVPVIIAEGKSFKEKTQIEIKTQNAEDNIYYSTNSTEFMLYTKPFYISETTTISAFTKSKTDSSSTISATFYKKPNHFDINILSTYNPQYHAGGKDALLDGIFGTTNWRKGDWQGYQSQDFECIIDLKETKSIQSISVNFLQDARAWILMPTEIEISFWNQKDHIIDTITTQKIINTIIKPEELDVKTQSFDFSNINSSVRFVKVKAKNFGKLPEWHQGFPYGGEAFIFIDEITIK